MKHKIKKTLIFILAVMTILSTAIITAFADDGTSTGWGESTTTVPVEGSIKPLTISVTHPTTLAYTINPDSIDGSAFIAPDIPITNNTRVPVTVTVVSIASTSGGTIQFTDVAADGKDWPSLGVGASKTYIALGVKVKDNVGWNTGYSLNTHYAADIAPMMTGSLPSGATGVLTMTACFGRALDRSYTAMHNLTLMFNLVKF